MSSVPQLALGFASSTPGERVLEPVRRSPTQHFGLSVHHRALFDALASEWLVPRDGRGHLLVRGGFSPPVAADEPPAPNQITVRISFDLSAAPGCPVWSLREDEWVALSSCELESHDRVLWWPGPLSVHDVQALEVATVEERARLLGIARQVSNLSLPALKVSDPCFFCVEIPEPPDTHEGPEPSLSLDRVRGSAAMGWWALPRTGPWFEFVAASFGTDIERSRAALADIGASWLEHLPWRPASEVPTSFDATLWRATTSVAASWSERVSFTLATAIVEAACAAAPEHADALHVWAQQTRAILRGESSLAVGSEHDNPVGMALLLVLARSSPDRYRTWVRDRQSIPPAVWWSGALLVGLLHGYSELPTGFRGEPSLRRFLALRLSARQTPVGPVEWSPSNETVDIRADGCIIDSKPQTARGLWYWADLGDSRVRADALELVRALGWPCQTRELLLSNQVVHVRGEGQLDREDRELRAVGEVRLSLPPDVELVEALDEAAFRHCLVTRGGELRPPSGISPVGYSPAELVHTHAGERALDRGSMAVAELPGLLYVRDFVSESEADKLIEAVDASPWLNVLERRVQHYGWKYDYKARKVTRGMQIGPLPAWAARVAERMHEARLLPWLADQVIVNEYCGNQGISKHVDCTPCFEEDVAMISLVETWHMRFCERETKRKVEQKLERGSLAIMTGAVRYDWTHEIPRRKKEPGGLVRQRRVSLTFRKVKVNTAVT